MSNSTVIGTTSNFYGVATFQSQPIITSTILANNDNSTNIATTAWANSFLTYAQTQPNTWTGAQTFTTANVSVLNVFKTSVDTINASSITSDMTIGANLNGGSLTLGAAGATTNINSNITNLATGGLTGSGRVNIATGANATGSEIKIGDTNSTTTLKGNTIVDGSNINSGTNIFCIKQNTGSIDNATDGIRDPLTISSPSGSTTAFLSLGMGVDTSYNCGYINCAMIGQGRPLVLSPRLGNVFVGPIPAGFDTASNSYTEYTNGNLIVSGNIYCNSPIIPKYSYGYGLNRIGGRYDNGGSGGVVLTIYGDGNWRNYLYCNDVPPGLYLFQYWANPGGMTYTNIQQRIHLSPTPFTGNSNIINNITLFSQTYVNPVPSLFGGVQTPHTFTLMVDSSNPHVCFAMVCNTNVNAGTYHGLMLTRIA